MTRITNILYTGRVQNVLGVQGVMELQKLLRCGGFDTVHQFVIDIMHNVFLGLAKQMTGFWLNIKWRYHPYNIYDRVREVDARLKSCRTQVTQEFDRPPRSVAQMVNYKG